MRLWSFPGLALTAAVIILTARSFDWHAGLGALGEVAAIRPDGSLIESLTGGNATQVYYQFVDDRNQVRFVSSIDLVPAEWRERVGYVELPVPPPMSPTDVKRNQYARSERRADREAVNRRGPEIILYSADWCSACRSAKKHMDANGIEYQERNVDEPRFEAMLVKLSGARSIPVFEIDGSVLSGFDPNRLDQMIASAS
jgi:glutaredoxin